MTVTEYVAKFNELVHFALSIMPTDDACKSKFMLRLKVDVAKQVDNGSHGLISFVDVIQRALRNENWDKDGPRMALVNGEKAVMLVEKSTSG